MQIRRITLARIGKNETIKYAVDELYSYLKKIDGTLFVDIRLYKEYDPCIKNVIWVGESELFSDKLLQVDDKFFDDSICIDVENNEGFITGCNPRSVLIASYRFLKELGVAWVRASDDGEIVPHYEIDKINVKVQEKASYRHRAICIEGSLSYEHVLEMIKWIPRAGMSGYYMQFFRPYNFFDRWYSHNRSHGIFEDENVSRLDVDAIVQELEDEIAKRGLVYHKVGHGWTAEPLGFTSDGWYQVSSDEIPEDIKPLISMIDGERKFYKDVPINTNLCYSNPKARKIVVDYIADYIRKNSHVQILHFWLGDGSNNVCECENCTERLSDYFVMMLNELDTILTEEGIDTKVAFLLYGNTFWAPVKEKFNESDRFVLMFAPIARDYSKTYKELDPNAEYSHPDYILNKAGHPRKNEEAYSLLKEWQSVYKGDSFDFDYHIMWDHMYDPGYETISKIIYDDMQSLENIGLNGMVSCQLTRVAFPTNLPMQIMADVLWDKNCDFEKKSAEYYAAAFGADGGAVSDYLKSLSEAFDPAYHRYYYREAKPLYPAEERLEKLGRVESILDTFAPVIKKNLETDHCPGVKASWEYLSVHAEYCRMLVKPLISKANDDFEERNVLNEELNEFVRHLPERVHKIFDEWIAFTLTERMTKMV